MRQCHESALGGRISLRSGFGHDGPCRGDVDDPPVRRTAMMAGKLAGCDKSRPEIEGENLIPFFKGQITDGFEHPPTGIVDENIDFAVITDDSLKHGRNRGCLPQVNAMEDRPITMVAPLGRQSPAVFFIDVRNDHSRTLRQKFARNCLADSIRTPCYQNDFPRKNHSPPPTRSAAVLTN